jgi:hypothetical protein
MSATATITALPRESVNGITPHGIPVVGAGLTCPILVFPNRAMVEIQTEAAKQAKRALIAAERSTISKASWSAEQHDNYDLRLHMLRTTFRNAVQDCFKQFGVQFEGRSLRVIEGRFAA